MATAKYYIIHIERKKDVSYEQIKEKMDLSLDWYRIRESLWIVYSTSDTEKWYERLNKYVSKEGRVFICKLDTSDRQGWMDQKFWDWLNRKDKS